MYVASTFSFFEDAAFIKHILLRIGYMGSSIRGRRVLAQSVLGAATTSITDALTSNQYPLH
jgi:hypothetical protein